MDLEEKDELLSENAQLIDKLNMLKIAHEVFVTMVKFYEPLVNNNACSSIEPIFACANPCCPEASNFCVEQL